LYFTLTSGLLFGRTLKVSALSALELALAPRATRAFLGFAKLMNSRLFRGNLHFQALGTNFRVWSDGIVSPLFEELPSTAQLIALEYDDVEGRHALMHDPRWVEDFRRDWLHGRTGGDWASFKARMGVPDHLVIRDLERLVFDGAPVPDWEGETLQQVSSACCASAGATPRQRARMPSARLSPPARRPRRTMRTSCCS
jgi:hypothetical protein